MRPEPNNQDGKSHRAAYASGNAEVGRVERAGGILLIDLDQEAAQLNEMAYRLAYPFGGHLDTVIPKCHADGHGGQIFQPQPVR